MSNKEELIFKLSKEGGNYQELILQVPHLTQDTIWVTKTQENITHKGTEDLSDHVTTRQYYKDKNDRLGPKGKNLKTDYPESNKVSEPKFYHGDLVYKLKKIVGSNIFSAQFIKILSHYEKIGYKD